SVLTVDPELRLSYARMCTFLCFGLEVPGLFTSGPFTSLFTIIPKQSLGSCHSHVLHRMLTGVEQVAINSPESTQRDLVRVAEAFHQANHSHAVHVADDELLEVPEQGDLRVVVR